jgi:hypothetical protein
MISRRLDKLSAGNALLKGNKMCSIINTTLTLFFYKIKQMCENSFFYYFSRSGVKQ